MQRPGGERAASGSSSSRTAARNPRDHESRTARWRLREQSTGNLPRKGFEHSECKASRRCTRRGLFSAAPAAGGYSVARWHSTAPRSDRPRTQLRREGLRHPSAKTVKLFRRGHEAPRALTGAKRAPRQVTSGEATYGPRSAAHRSTGSRCKGVGYAQWNALFGGISLIQYGTVCSEEFHGIRQYRGFRRPRDQCGEARNGRRFPR